MEKRLHISCGKLPLMYKAAERLFARISLEAHEDRIGCCPEHALRGIRE